MSINIELIFLKHVVHKSQQITLFTIGVLPYDLSSTVTSPGGITEDAEINEVEDGLYAVHFVPKELGIHTVSVRYKDVHIPGK